MDIGTALSVAQTLFAALQCTQLRDVFSILGHKDELDNLAKTVDTIKAVLLDAESMADGLTHQAQCYVDDLKYAIFEADDLLDKFVTLSERKHQKLTKEGAAKALAKARALFSPFKDLPTAYNMSKQVQSIRKKLDVIADNHNKFGFKLDSQPIRTRREETCSYVYDKDIIGRDTGRKQIVHRLLQTNAERDVSFLTIVGIGGLGKTALAQLVFNDDKIQAAFSTRYWACVGDEDTQHMNVKAVLAQILGYKQDEFTLESLGCKFQEKLTKQKYLMILDDVWIENQLEWQKLEVFLKGGARGSWVLVTTRSSTTATIIGDGSSYHLKGLSDKDSWRLFEMVAFGGVGGQENPPADLVEIGQKVVQKCANVPLAIRVAGSLLYGQPRPTWESFEKNGFANLDPNKNGILPILKFSYYHLESPLKCCFCYCALFPKDYRIEKEMLIRLWEAQGYIVSFGEERKEDVAEEYFSILLRRCFFQDVIKHKDGEIRSFKIHDLLHDVARQVAGKEISRVDHFIGELDNRIVHLNVHESMNIKGNSSRKTIRTLLFDYPYEHKFNENHPSKHKFNVGALLENWMSLRALSLRNLELKKIPDAIGKLIHLRLVDFTGNSILVKLPKSFTKLHNLETLILEGCGDLRELPADIDKLVKLRCLNIESCSEELHIPKSIGKLRSLQMLPYFGVKMSNSLRGIEGLEGLRTLDQLKGSLHMEFFCCDEVSTNVKEEIGEGAILINKQHLNQIELGFRGDGGQDYQEALVERLQPHLNLKHLSIFWYTGGRLPSWAREQKLESSLSNLVIVRLHDCDGLKYLSGMGKLHHLRELYLDSLLSLEYMEESRNRIQLEEKCLFFPSLKILELRLLPKLKRWWREEGKEHDLHSQPSPSFPHLLQLNIESCKEITLIPAFPSAEKLVFTGVNERLRISVGGVNEKEEKTLGRKEVEGPTCSTQCTIKTDNVRLVKSLLSMKALQCLTELNIHLDQEVETLEEGVEVWRSCSSSLRILTVNSCPELKSVYKGCLEHLSALEKLTIFNCLGVTLSDDKGDDGKSSLYSSLYPPFSQTLRFLCLKFLPKLANLPEWMQHLNSLQTLYMYECYTLKSLPEWMQHLTSLTDLKITNCSKELEQRCSSNLPGQDWPYICRIPNVRVSSVY